jgi:hypothetical protein
MFRLSKNNATHATIVMKLRFVIIKRQLYVVMLLRVKFHNFIQCYLEINKKKNLYLENNNKLNKLFTTKVTKVKHSLTSNAFHLS